MSVTLTVSRDYGYVILAATSTFVMNILHMLNTGGKRKACKDMPYPLAYATAEQNAASQAHMTFSCAARSHANFIESQPSALAAMLICGLQYPRVAAGLGLLWSLSRYVYMVGYSDPSKGPNGRLRGFYGSAVAQLSLIGLAGYSGLQVAGFV